nr:unnamed protein product [Callosobruchus analis]
MAKQRDLFLNLSYGRHESGSLSEYFMNLVNQANFLTERIPEEKLTKMLSKHFSSEIQRGIVTLGLKTIDEIDEYLREVDENERASYTNEGSRGQGQGSNWRSQPQGNSYAVSNEGQGDGNVRQVMSHLTAFNDENDFLNSDSESEEVSEQSKFKSPILRAKVGSVESDIIVDSGSEVSAISEKFFDEIKQHLKVPVLPVSGLAISPAFGAKRQRIKWQILLSIQQHCPGVQNKVADALSRFPHNKDLRLSPERPADLTVIIQKPKCLLSDNGTQFTSKKWGEELAKMGIQIKLISVYFPEGNVTERYNREVGRLLRMYCHEKHSKWACVVDFVEDCLNTAVSISTGYSPRYLQFGAENEHPVTKFIRFPIDVQVKPSLQSIWLLAHDRMTKQAKRRALKHAAEITPIEFGEGDKVLVRTHAQSSAEDKTIKKFFHLYAGPFWVLRKAGPNCYTLRDAEGQELPKQNIINLKAYRELPPGFPM